MRKFKYKESNETRVLGLRLKLLGQVWPPAPIFQIRRYGEGQRKKIYYMAWDMPEEEVCAKSYTKY
jgi:hypothetical protein